ncbi:MAG: class I SAM-dependent methyltransferase [Clostridia bacterium]
MNKLSVKLNTRLKVLYSIAEHINASIYVDIGADHGKLSAALALNSSVLRVIATDISALSLDKAKILIKKLDLDAKVDFRVGNGLSVLEENEADAIIISGMGAETIKEILKSANFTPKNLLLQPTRAPGILLEYLFNSGFSVEKEEITFFDGRYYQTFFARHTGFKDPSMMNFEKELLFFSPRALIDGDPYLKPMLEKYKNTLEKKLERSSKNEALLLELLKVKKAIDLSEEDSLWKKS